MTPTAKKKSAFRQTGCSAAPDISCKSTPCRGVSHLSALGLHAPAAPLRAGIDALSDTMKISGYSTEDVGRDPEHVRFIDLAEITITASPAEVRCFAAFLAGVADTMERMGNKYSHEHLADRQPGFDESPHVTVFNSDLEG